MVAARNRRLRLTTASNTVHSGSIQEIGLQRPSSLFLQSLHYYLVVRRYSIQTIGAYLYCIKHFILQHNKRRPLEPRGEAVVRFPALPAAGRERFALATPWWGR